MENSKTLSLRFHEFFKMLPLPLGILGSFASIFNMFVVYQGSQRNVFFYVDVILSAVNVALAVALFIGLFWWKRWTYKVLLWLTSLNIFYYLAATLLTVIFVGKPDIYALGKLVAVLVWYPLIVIYYRKRRFLFENNEENNV